VIAAVGRAGEAFVAGFTVASRAAALARLAGELRSHREPLARLATAEMGKPITQSRIEIDRCVHALEYLSAEGPGWLAEDPRDSEASYSAVRFDPLGVILGVMPWNFPYWQIVRFASGALLAGNTVLIKPAPSTVGCALALQERCRAAGLTEGVYTTLLAELPDLEAVVAHDAVAAVSLTGSVRAGRALAVLAARFGKPAVLELGGSDAFIVLDDADVAAAAFAGAGARCFNAGQSCIAAKRFIATAGVYDDLKNRLAAAMAQFRVGDPAEESTEVGPLARQDLLEALRDQLRAGVRAGGKVVEAAPPPPGLPATGHFFAPTLLELDGPNPGSNPCWSQETFGPLAVIVQARDTEHALALASESRYGLGASLWTQNRPLARSLAERLPVGNVSINAAVKSNVRLPFGGVRDSGFGRELGAEGVRQFTNIKTVWVA
jgi:succinate-semialdehyde dehydrogenase/glutarate-semialdehyde dehydrogenase